MFSLYVGRVRKGLDEKNQWNGSLSDTSIQFENVEQAEEVVRICKLLIWKIMDDNSSGVIKESEMLKAEYEKQKQERKQYEDMQNKRVNKINAMPSEYRIYDKNIDNQRIRIIVKRNTAKYDPKISKIVMWGLNAFIQIDEQKPKNLYLDYCISRDGKSLKMKLNRELGLKLGFGLADQIVNDTGTIIKAWQQIKKSIDSVGL